jgi:hypothetical protein
LALRGRGRLADSMNPRSMVGIVLNGAEGG